MMLVELPAIDAVSVPALPSLHAFDFGLVYALTRPSTWLVVLATIVILSSIRAALLYARPPTWTEGRKSVSFVAIVKEEKALVGATPTVSASGSTTQSGKSASATNPTPARTEDKKMTSWLWGLVKWDTLPAPPVRRQWQYASSAPQMQQVQQSIRRSGPAFEHPLPALYDTQEPLSMAKMIMSRHTFRRPTSRPPPVRNANAPQYQRRTPNMV